MIKNKKMGDNVRAKSAEFLEKLVQCPVCMDRPEGAVPMCLKGHHLCRSCRDRLSKCPICKADFCDIKNFAVEELCTKVSDLISLLLEPRLYNSTATMTPSTSSESIPMSVDDPMQSCRIGSCRELLPGDCMYRHVRVHHSDSLIEVNTRRQNDTFSGDSCSKIWRLRYNLNRAYDYALYAENLGLFFVNLLVNGEGELLAALRMANPQRNVKLHYEMSAYVPGKNSPEEFQGTVQECSTKTDKFLQARKYAKRFFACYFEPDFVTLNDKCTEPFTFSLYIHHLSSPIA